VKNKIFPFHVSWFHKNMIAKLLSHEVPVYQAGLVFLCLYFTIEYFKGDKKSKKTISDGDNNNSSNENINNNNSIVTSVQDEKQGREGTVKSVETKVVVPQTEVDQEAEEYMDEEDSVLTVKNNYGMLDGPFKLMLCVNMSLNMGKVSHCLFIFVYI
jgi:hypothetical protein